MKQRFTLALYGTPIENGIEELGSLMELLNPGFQGLRKAFIRTYGDAYADDSRLLRLRKMLAPFILRRTKDAVLKDLNLVASQYIFLYEPWWNAAAERQAADRICRIGRDKPVFIYHFLVRNMIIRKLYSVSFRHRESLQIKSQAKNRQISR